MPIKVITELAYYLMERGLLSDEDHTSLVKRGLIEGRGSEEEPEVAEEAGEPEHEEHDRPARPSRGRAPKKPKIDVEDLDRWIASNLDTWSDEARPLLPLARLFVDVESAIDAPRVLSSKEVDELEPLLESALAARAPSLDELWPALVWSHPPPPFGAAGGPGVGALRRALDAGDRAALGSYAWILKHPGIRWLYHFARAQHLLLKVLARLAETPARLAAAFSETKDDAPGLALALLHTSRSRRRGLELRGDALSWSPQIWAAAMRMDSIAVAKFFRTLIERPVLRADGSDRLVLGAVSRAAFDIEHRQLVTLHEDRSIAAWDDTSGEFIRLLARAPAGGLRFSFDGRHLVSFGRREAFDVRSEELLKLTISRPRLLEFDKRTMRASNKSEISGARGVKPLAGTARGLLGGEHFSPLRGRIVQRWSEQGLTPFTVAEVDDGVSEAPGTASEILASWSGTVAVYYWPRIFAVWDLQRGVLAQWRLVDDKSLVDEAALSADGRWLALVLESHRAWIYDLATGAAPLLLDLNGPTHGVTLSPRGKYLAGFDLLHRVRIWRLGGPELVHNLGVPGPLDPDEKIIFSPDEERFAVLGWGAVFVGAALREIHIGDLSPTAPEIWRGKWWYRYESGRTKS